MKNILIVLNDGAYGSERSYNGLRLANNLLKMDDTIKVTLFLMGDGVTCAKRGQNTPQGYYNLERMLKPIARRGEILLCGSCMDARGIAESEICEGCRKSSLDELTENTIKADKVLIF